MGIFVHMPNGIFLSESRETADMVRMRMGHHEDIYLGNVHPAQLRVYLIKTVYITAINHHDKAFGGGEYRAIAGIDLVLGGVVYILEREVSRRKFSLVAGSVKYR